MQDVANKKPEANTAFAGDEFGGLHRTIDWKGAFWIASGVPALVLISIGGMGATAGKLAFLVWTISVVMGFLQAYSYAEIAGLFKNKSGGAAVYGSAAWLRYSKLIAPLSVWCNWYAWTPVLSLGCAIAAGYILNAIAPIPVFGADSPEVLAWLKNAANAAAIDGKSAEEAAKLAIAAVTEAATPALRTMTLASFSFFGLANIEIGPTFFIGAALMLITFAIQHRGVLGTARVQMAIGLLVVIPMLIVGIVPYFNGGVNYQNYTPLVPPNGEWNNGGWTFFLGALFIAGWSTYAFETAVCYTREFKNPASDTKKSIIAAGLLCVLLYTLVAASFQGYLGLEGMTQPGIVDGTGVAAAMGHMVGGGSQIITHLLEMMMILALILAIQMAMAGSSRTLYQGGVDGWLPKYLAHTNEHGAPTRAMWTDLIFNLGLLTFAASDATAYYLILSISNVGYMIFIFLNLQATWIHRIDSPNIPRPYRAPNWLIAVNAGLGFFNLFLMGVGAKVWGNPNALWYGLAFGLLIIPVFLFRHYVQDKGRFPDHMLIDLDLKSQDLGERRAGILPYLALAAGAAIVLFGHYYFQLPS
ncbi:MULTISPECIES: APC family permease [Hyphomicrobium]|jgi:amino acid transporter|uniref:APC family permease n=1 Tax=Hyphomicrobium TaxID=81 RepID=UPI000367B000|nr:MULTISPECIES: APC family permease [Hyphomicrobium]WBT39307.1 APC family permease [Hyphomicrobium sp. DMF-1]HML44920.1 APC family permease [Hyphomicrobium zavarzinii]